MPPLHTTRLTLRNFCAKDAAPLLAYLHQPVSTCFLSMALPDLAAAQAEVEKRSASEGQIAVVLTASDSLIGDLFAEPEEDTFSVGWNFNPQFGGQGYALEAARALFAHLFTSGKARRLYAYVEDTNLASQKLCHKLGMRQEGAFKEFVTFTQDAQGQPIYENTLQFALLRSEWLAQQASQ